MLEPSRLRMLTPSRLIQALATGPTPVVAPVPLVYKNLVLSCPVAASTGGFADILGGLCRRVTVYLVLWPIKPSRNHYKNVHVSPKAAFAVAALNRVENAKSALLGGIEAGIKTGA